MGYYDGPNLNEEHSEMREMKKSGSKKGYFFTGLVGAVVGAVSISFAAPYMPWVQNNGAAVSSFNSNKQVEGTVVPVVNKAKNETDLPGMIEGAKDVVVGVINMQQSVDPFAMQPTGQEETAGTGSGVIYKKSGNKAYIVTNNHVVDGANKLAVKLSDGKQVDAKLVGKDPWLDLAVVEIDGSNVNKVASLGDSSKIRAGEKAIAIGNPLGFDGSVTEGIISSKEREIPVDIDGDKRPDWQAQVIQTDAAINPGNSGGALFNQNGEVIGINSSKIAQQSVEGIGFAIPINIAKPVIESLEKDGVVKRPALGVGVVSLEDVQAYAVNQLKVPKEVTNGVVLGKIYPISPAEKAGLEQYDIVVALDDQKVENSLQFRKYLYEKKKVGEKVEVTFYRNGQKMTKTATLADNSATKNQ
ncbi:MULTISPECIES: S1C family serine protease [Bacillus cereus group]|uniref:S1C family serine protease n=1 Tax=Bacillus cereus group TaxID=86661 RepID=UPI001F59CE17|nr:MULTISPECIES: trypsin-like peptidase domain-containing protein [Bacillus cereus group]MED0969660.1 trypsin-like peptidase domain-containing protein [Bacillus paramycoides]MED0978542.1 trypsin-like peptidase domain-containing protein [Bacillus paramycoides]MED0983254.1 trypsin-like peptidase domain-containing protein [Bacillus paramycoides]MED1092994.1 trypsin-like peptidase domain-containing protein [Bacillus paramycoides]MED1105164.1 trypsin-like peptidase domain-containing protein [Bacill